jgi:hypothetical protein
MRTTFIALIGAVTTAIAISGTGMTAASARPRAVATEHFQEVASAPASNTARVIAYGTFTATGTDVQHKNTDTFKFPGGSFLVTPRYTLQSMHLNKRTCLLTQTLQLTYTISHGTGRYAGIRGSGHGTLSNLEITARNSHGACSTSKTPLAQQVIAHAHGPVTLP